MKTTELVFIGIKGSVVALNRSTGEQVWATHLKGYDFVNVILDGDSILATCYGEVFCLDPLTGDALWHNPLKGYGVGLTTIATGAQGQDGLTAAVTEKRRRDAQAAAAATMSAN